MEISTQYKNQQLIEALLPTKNFLNLQTLSNIPASPTSTPKINKLYNNNKQKHTQKKTAKIVFFFLYNKNYLFCIIALFTLNLFPFKSLLLLFHASRLCLKGWKFLFSSFNSKKLLVAQKFILYTYKISFFFMRYSLQSCALWKSTNEKTHVLHTTKNSNISYTTTCICMF